MLKKYKNLILIFTTVVLFSVLARGVFALEINYPTIGQYRIDCDSKLGDYVAYFYQLAVVSAGFLGVLSIVIAGIKLIGTSGSPGAASEAKERIFQSVLGIILIMTCFIILRTINTDIFSVREDVSPDTNGVRLVKTVTSCKVPVKIYIPAPKSVSDFEKLKKEGYDTISYKCDQPGVPVWVWKYSVKDLDDNDTNATTFTLQCKGLDEKNIADIKSFKWEEEKPGVYLYKDAGCVGLSTNVIDASQEIPAAFQKKSKSAKIINGGGPFDGRFGFIANQSPDNRGYCSLPEFNDKAGSDECLYDPDTPCVDNSVCVGIQRPDSCNPQFAQLPTSNSYWARLKSTDLPGLASLYKNTTPRDLPSLGKPSPKKNVAVQKIPIRASLASINYTQLAVAEGESPGCTDLNALNFDTEATSDDGSCSYGFCSPGANGSGECSSTGTGAACVNSGQCGGNGAPGQTPPCRPYAAYIRIINGFNPDNPYSPESAGDGVTFYEDGGVNNDGSELDGPYYVSLSESQIGKMFVLTGEASDNTLGYAYTNPDDLLGSCGSAACDPSDPDTNRVASKQDITNPKAKDLCLDPRHNYPCAGSLEVRGNFEVVYYSNNQENPENKESDTCDFFRGDVNFYNQPKEFVISNGRKVYRVYVYPTAN